MSIGREAKSSCPQIWPLSVKCKRLMVIWLFLRTIKESQQPCSLRMAAGKCKCESSVHWCEAVTSSSTASLVRKLVYRSVPAETPSPMGKPRTTKIPRPCSLRSFQARRRSSHRSPSSWYPCQGVRTLTIGHRPATAHLCSIKLLMCTPPNKCPKASGTFRTAQASTTYRQVR